MFLLNERSPCECSALIAGFVEEKQHVSEKFPVAFMTKEEQRKTLQPRFVNDSTGQQIGASLKADQQG